MQLNVLLSKLEELEGTLEDVITPYEMSKITNRLLGTDLPPQMFYNYIKNRYISSTTFVDRGKTKKGVKKSEVLRWIEKYAIQNVVTSR